MFLLSYTKSEEFRKQFQDCVLGGRFLSGHQDRDLIEYRDRIDPGAAAGQYLGYRTTRTLEELNGIESEHGVEHWSLFKILELSPTDRREIGRAMVLADRPFGAIDEIAWNGFLDAFKDFASHREYSFSVGKEKKLSAAKLRHSSTPTSFRQETLAIPCPLSGSGSGSRVALWISSSAPMLQKVPHG